MRRLLTILVVAVAWLWGGIAVGAPISVPKPPKEYQGLIDAACVQIQFYDPNIHKESAEGKTYWHVVAKRKSDWKWKSRKEGDQKLLTIDVDVKEVTFAVNHEVRIPVKYANEKQFWARKLVIHELDHVSISTDPRPRRLINHLYRNLKVIERQIPDADAVTKESVKSIVDEEFRKRNDAVVELIRANQNLLDQVAQHGVQVIGDRKAFFHTLYTKENLAEAKFPFVDDVLDLLETDAYQKAEFDQPNTADKPDKLFDLHESSKTKKPLSRSDLPSPGSKRAADATIFVATVARRWENSVRPPSGDGGYGTFVLAAHLNPSPAAWRWNTVAVV